MLQLSELLLIAGVVGVGVLHTMVPDHWLPIALLARQRGWTRMETARAALQAGVGHVVTTLLFGLAVWLVGSAAAARFGKVVDIAASVALVGFGLWIALGAWRELRGETHPHEHHHGVHDHGGGHSHTHGHSHEDGWARDPLYKSLRGMGVAERHLHWHRHGQGPAHSHWHDHDGASAHRVTSDGALAAPLHLHQHGTSGRTALLLVLGSSPMVEGIPAFFAASSHGIGLVAWMAVAFAASTIATYVLLSVYSASSLQRFNLGPLEQYGEVISGGLIVLIGLVFGALSLG